MTRHASTLIQGSQRRFLWNPTRLSTKHLASEEAQPIIQRKRLSWSWAGLEIETIAAEPGYISSQTPLNILILFHPFDPVTTLDLPQPSDLIPSFQTGDHARSPSAS